MIEIINGAAPTRTLTLYSRPPVAEAQRQMQEAYAAMIAAQRDYARAAARYRMAVGREPDAQP